MKKISIIVFIIVLVVLAGGGAYILRQKRQSEVISPEVAGTLPTPSIQELLTWEDPAGFTFQYPKDAEIDKHDEDQVNYAHIELTSKNHPGTIIVWAKDTTAADSATWVKAEKSLSGGTVFDTSLSGISGKKVLLTAPKKTIISAIVDEGVVFYVEGVFDESEYFSKAYDSITSSFTFSTGSQLSAPAADPGEEVSVDEEEIIE